MAKRAEGVTERLLAAAKQEFLEKGYEHASLRSIARRAGSSKGAIYIRYEDKFALYRAIVDPVIDMFCDELAHTLDAFSELSGEDQERLMDTYSDEGEQSTLRTIFRNYDAFKILVSSGEAKAYGEFIHRLVEIESDCTTKFIEITGHDAFSAGRLTDDLMHIIYNAFFSGVFEVVAHDMPEDEARSHFARLRRFYTAGWQTILYPDRTASADENPSRKQGAALRKANVPCRTCSLPPKNEPVRDGIPVSATAGESL